MRRRGKKPKVGMRSLTLMTLIWKADIHAKMECTGMR